MNRTTKLITVAAGAAVVYAALRYCEGSRYEILYSFANQQTDKHGWNPNALVTGRDGSVYGTTYSGGDLGHGTVFRVTREGRFDRLHSFGGPADSACCPAGLVEAGNREFYGTTFEGGIVYRVETNGSFSLIHRFTGGADGELIRPGFPAAGTLQLAQDGSMYGITSRSRLGGTNQGAIYRVTPEGEFKILHTFTGKEDGANPVSVVELNEGGYLGTTESGSIFRIDRDGAFRSAPISPGLHHLLKRANGTVCGFTADSIVLISGYLAITAHKFTAERDGNDIGEILEASDGSVVGIASSGGISNAGTLFRLSPDRTLSLLHSFTGLADGANPVMLTKGSRGAVYGATRKGGAHGAGVVFMAAPDVFRILGSFRGGDIIQGIFERRGAGPLWGATLRGGKYNGGILFAIMPHDKLELLHEFGGPGDGAELVDVALVRDECLIGATISGDAEVCHGGTVFRYRMH